MEQVRYAAWLDTGETFFAFAGGYLIVPERVTLETGEVFLPEGRILPDGCAVWPFPKLRRMVPTEDEHIYLVDAFELESVKMVTDLGDGTFLIGTDHPVANAKWGGKVTEYAWDRAAYIEVAMA